VCTTEELPRRLHSVPNDLALAVFAYRGHTLDCAFEAVKDVHGALSMNLERQVVIVPTYLALRHLGSLERTGLVNSYASHRIARPEFGKPGGGSSR
jgi:hypothetical protein